MWVWEYINVKILYTLKVVIRLKQSYKYKFFYVRPMVVIRQKPMVDTQKIEKSTYTSTENHQITK